MAINSVLLLAGGWWVPTLFAMLSLLFKPKHRVYSAVLFITGCCLLAGALFSWYEVSELPVPGWVAVGWIPVSFKCDTLSSFFLLLLSAVVTCCAPFSSKYLSHLGNKISPRLYWCALLIFISGMALVLLAANAVVFLVAWELMSLSSALLVVSEYEKHNAQKAAFIYLVSTRIATIFITAGFLLMFGRFHDVSFGSWSFSNPNGWLPASLILIGLMIKAGIWPFHIWLPYAHTEAPSPVSALMSGVMVKIAVYAAARFFICGHLTSPWIIYALFGLSAISAFWGVLFAINQRELKRLLAYSTVENVGLIFMSLALCMWARQVALEMIAQLALLAALLHTLGHGLIKSLLFLCAGSVDCAAHSREFAMLGGLNKRMPITGLAFVIGCASICALPPLNGFASKWCLYQALLKSSFTMPSIFDRAVCLAAIGALSLVGALAVACFAKAAGVAFLGNPRTNQARVAQEVPASMFMPQVVLAAGCIVMGMGVQLLVPPLAPILLIVGGPRLENVFDSVPLLQLAGMLTAFLLAIYLLAFRRAPVAFQTWDCGFGKAVLKSQTTADSFAQPIARIFTPVLRHDLTVNISGRDRRHFPERIEVEPSMVSLLETKVYEPALQIVNRLSQIVAKLQAGSIHLYLAYVCAALVALIVLATKL